MLSDIQRLIVVWKLVQMLWIDGVLVDDRVLICFVQDHSLIDVLYAESNRDGRHP